MNIEELQNNFANKDQSVLDFEEMYGNYVENDLIPQLSRLSAYKLTANPLKYRFTKTKGMEKFNEKVEEIFSTIDINSIAFVLEEKLSREGNGVVVFEKKNNNEFNLYVPTMSITKVDPSSGSLYYLQIIRYLHGGDLVNVVSEVHTLNSTTYTVHEYNDMDSAKKDVEKVRKSKGTKELSNKIGKDKIKETHKELRDIDLEDDEHNLGFIKAVYFENIPTTNKRGEPDINRKSRYIPLLNKTMVRFFWEIEFNKSKFIEEEEMGSNIFGSEFRNQQNQSQIANNFVKRTNNFFNPMGSASSGYQYFETTNQNLINLIQMFNYFIKKLWEQSGQHQSGSDIGKQISDLQAEMERGAEHLRFNNKALRRQIGWRELLWRIFLTIDNKVFGKFGKAPKGLKKSDILFNITYAKVDIEKEIIQNEIMKLQSNLTNREEAISRIQRVSPDQDINSMAEKYLGDNIADILKQQIPEERQLEQKPVQVQNPSMNNPQGSTNNQSKKFNKQLGKSGDKPVHVTRKDGTTFQRASKGMGEKK